jgi:hypothetical protein
MGSGEIQSERSSRYITRIDRLLDRWLMTPEGQRYRASLAEADRRVCELLEIESRLDAIAAVMARRLLADPAWSDAAPALLAAVDNCRDRIARLAA